MCVFVGTQGVFQCGVRDLYERIALHPDVAIGNTVTSNFFFEKRPFKDFMSSMDRAVSKIVTAPQKMVAGDASAGARVVLETFGWCCYNSTRYLEATQQ